MAEVKWIKITVDMFDNRKIKHLRRLPEGNSIVLIWVMLLTMAGRCNAGGMIFLTENIPYTPKMLADELQFEESTVQLALRALDQLGMIRMSENGFLHVSGWAEYQNEVGLEHIREQNRLRKKAQRCREQEQLLTESTGMSRDSHVTQRDSHATDIDIDRDIEEDKEIRIVLNAVVDYLNEKAGTKYRKRSEKTERHILARIHEGFTLDDFKAVIDSKVAEWSGTDMAKFIRPETLFGTKFEGYLNAERMGKNGEHQPDHADAAAGNASGTGRWL